MRMATSQRIRDMRQVLETMMAAEPSGNCRVAYSTPAWVVRLWLIGKLNSTPPAYHAPRELISCARIASLW